MRFLCVGAFVLPVFCCGPTPPGAESQYYDPGEAPESPIFVELAFLRYHDYAFEGESFPALLKFENRSDQKQTLSPLVNVGLSLFTAGHKYQFEESLFRYDEDMLAIADPPEVLEPGESWQLRLDVQRWIASVPAKEAPPAGDVEYFMSLSFAMGRLLSEEQLTVWTETRPVEIRR